MEDMFGRFSHLPALRNQVQIDLGFGTEVAFTKEA